MCRRHLIVAVNPKSRQDWISCPYTGCWHCVDAELAIGQCRFSGGARNLWSEQPLAPPAEDVITGCEIPVDLPM